MLGRPAQREAPGSLPETTVRERLTVPIAGGQQADRLEVGGKGASLIRLAAAGLPVPPGSVFTSAFFAPWYRRIMASRTWTELMEAPPDAWALLCSELKEQAANLPLRAEQHEALRGLLRDLSVPGQDLRVAVRSSAPEEDLEAASFAGLYETRLGVRAADFEAAVRNCFVSSLDLRVFAYKREHGFEVGSPRFAVVVQRQLDSEVAGVGFSLNPLTNDYDEAVIDANWGLGVSVVEGSVSPDHFVIDKVGGEVVESTRGGKEVSVWLAPGGGTVERRDHRSAEPALSPAQLRELTGLICEVEALYDAPVDVEWAYAGGRLYVLQARAITTWVPLPPELRTPPGERRRLYADAALSKGLTINRPISPLGLDAVERSFAAILESWVGHMEPAAGTEEALHLFAGGRMYLNLSSLMWFSPPAMMARSSAPTDALMAAILAGVDAKRYRAARRPPWVSLRLLWLVPRVLWGLRGILWNAVRAIAAPERAHRRYRRRIDALEEALHEHLDSRLPLDDLQRRCERLIVRELDVLMSALLVGMMSPDRVVRTRTAESRALADRLTRGVPGNVVVEMGIALHRLAGLLDRSELEDLPRLTERIGRRRVPPEFLSAWQEFLRKYGCRGPLEMDLASARYGDDPLLALGQMSSMVADGGFDPAAAHRRQVEARRRAYEELTRRSTPPRRALLRRLYALQERFAGARDTPKHLSVLANYAIRRRALAEGRRLVREGRLDAPEHVFDLRFEDLRAAAADPALDLRAVREERIRFHRELEARVTSFPAVIDSRGRILRPPPAGGEPGVMTGMAVSPGVATGPVKVLHRPGEKPIEEGDVLVAYTTDPGWTPLFVNAAAVVLEIGGVLQHGAIVARELGKPCVAGIDRVAETLRDGELVEVDGTRGTVRLL